MFNAEAMIFVGTRGWSRTSTACGAPSGASGTAPRKAWQTRRGRTSFRSSRREPEQN